MTTVTPLQTFPDRPPALDLLLPDADRDFLLQTAPDARYLDASAPCMTCQGTGRFRWWPIELSAGAAPVEWHCDCRSQRIVARRFLLHGVRMLYARHTWADAAYGENPAALGSVRDWLEAAPRVIPAGQGLVLTGPTGVGKTLLMALTVKALLAQGISATLTSVTEMTDRFAEGWKDETIRRRWRERIEGARVLAIDDLGREWSRQTLPTQVIETVVRYRTQSCLPTLITTNRDPATFSDAYGPHLVSLLAETAEIVPMHGADLRAKMRERRQAEIAAGLSRPVAWW